MSCPPGPQRPGVAARVVILGAGHGGLRCANALAPRLARRGAVTVVARENYFLYYPFLRDLVAGAADLTEVAFPLREVLDPRVRLVVGDLARVDAQGREARVRLPDGEERALRYDHLVIALGSSTAYHGVPGARESAVAFKSVDDALALRLRVLDALESEESGGRLSPDVVVAGGSYAGLEVAGALHDLLRRAHRVYGPALRARPPVIHVVEGERRLLGGMPDPIPEYVQALLRRRGDDVALGERVAAVEPGGARLQGGRLIPAAATVWVAGVEASPAVNALPFQRGKEGRLRVDPMLRVEEGVWALGDCADARVGGKEAPMTAQHAEAEAESVASNLVRALLGRPLLPYHHRTRGLIVPLGEGLGVAQVGRDRALLGRSAGLLWRAFHLSRLPGASRKARYVAGWMTGAPRQRALIRAPAFTFRASSRPPS